MEVSALSPCTQELNPFHAKQWCSQNTEKVTHIIGRLLYQAMILYNNVPLKWKLL